MSRRLRRCRSFPFVASFPKWRRRRHKNSSTRARTSGPGSPTPWCTRRRSSATRRRPSSLRTDPPGAPSTSRPGTGLPRCRTRRRRKPLRHCPGCCNLLMDRRGLTCTGFRRRTPPRRGRAARPRSRPSRRLLRPRRLLPQRQKLPMLRPSCPRSPPPRRSPPRRRLPMTPRTPLRRTRLLPSRQALQGRRRRASRV